VEVHLIRLCLFLEYELSIEKANNAIMEAGKRKNEYFKFDPIPSFGEITVADVVKVNNTKAHISIVKSWEEYTWESWSAHHSTIRAWLPKGWVKH